MSQPIENRVRPSAWWYGLPALVWASAIVVVVAVVWSLGRDVIDTVAAVENGSRVDVPTQGLTVFTSGPLDETADCAMVSGNTSTNLDPFSADFTVSTDGPKWRAVASTPDDLPAGSYELMCSQFTGQLGLGQKIDVSSFVVRIVVGIVLPMALGLVGLIMLVVVVVKRHQSISRIRA